ncbi:hypothetical protein XU06_29265 [Rhodococcus erythropolis]|uniref:hypothetical protein n=1 Tax=Rhodococcus erythropolis TaxID=1833 RepID=UPI00061B8387|nr:hypothetical protein [Rhodococcus erythropolis]AKE00297.1 hypothetical protein XU06_29265 [Rhodococcus erythropolis]OXM23305.1 hypothetical protein CBI33_07845 [Rhodococcus erythropolis]
MFGIEVSVATHIRTTPLQQGMWAELEPGHLYRWYSAVSASPHTPSDKLDRKARAGAIRRRTSG